MKVQRSSPRGQTTSRNSNFALFALIFLIFFLILYDLNRKHTNFQLNWTEGVAYRNFTISARNLKHHPDSELGALEVEFGPLPMGKPGWMQNLILPNFFLKKSTSIRVHMQKL
jgi:hypothetical protein